MSSLSNTRTHTHANAHPHTHSHTSAQALKFLLFRADLCITLFRSSDGTTSKGLFPFELTGFYRETALDRDREEETKRKSLL